MEVEQRWANPVSLLVRHGEVFRLCLSGPLDHAEETRGFYALLCKLLARLHSALRSPLADFSDPTSVLG